VGTLPTLKPREVVALPVPFHAGRDISPTLLRKIAKDIGLAAEELLKGDRASEQRTEPDHR
jgi:hypothetical protein